MPEERDILQIMADAAGEEGLLFLLIGGHAVNAHGYSRTTLDFDLLLPAGDLPQWERLLARNGYHKVHQTAAFAQFQPLFPPGSSPGFRVDLMLVDASTFGKLHASGVVKNYAGHKLRVVSLLHLFALKLHALRNPDRAALGKDYFDIVTLARLHRIPSELPELHEILDRHASPGIRARLLRDLAEPFPGGVEGEP